MRETATIRPPGDKSITHRALLLSALSGGRAALRNPLASADTQSTASVLRQLGVEVGPIGESATVEVAGRPWCSPSDTLYCGNSGTTARLLLGALAGHPLRARLDGDGSLRRRPMRRVTLPLIEMGARVIEEGGDGLPLSIVGGRLTSIRYESPAASAQVKSALLFAGLASGVPVTIVEPSRSRDHTERMLRYIGFDVRCNGLEVRLEDPGDALRSIESLEFDIPGDPSSAAFLVAAACLTHDRDLRVEHVCVNPTRTGFLDVVKRMGGVVHTEREMLAANEPVADLRVSAESLCGIEVAGEEVATLIDEVPVLAVLAARAEGETTFRSVGELRLKESNRLDLVAANLRRIGAQAEVSGDDLHVCGTDAPLSGRIETAGDHRILMAFSVLASDPGVALEFTGTDSCMISYPNFYQDLLAVRGND